MNKVLVIGCPGSGKSTLSFKLSQLTGIPLIVLDKYYWQEDWTPMDEERWKSCCADLISRDRWIMDGTYSSTLKMRLNKADTVVFLDRGTFTCLIRVLKRIFRLHGKVRPSMADGCPEKFELNFLHYIVTFDLVSRARINRLLDNVRPGLRIFRLRSDRAYADFLEAVNSARK